MFRLALELRCGYDKELKLIKVWLYDAVYGVGLPLPGSVR